MAQRDDRAETVRAHEAAYRLVGKTLEGGWSVLEMIQREEGATGGHFSVGYIVEHEDGRRAYLKALDYSEAVEADDPPSLLERATAEFNHERDLARRCAGLTRVVSALGDGRVKIDEVTGIQGVNYLIFELAEGDIRKYMSDATQTLGVEWRLRCSQFIWRDRAG
jgi:eukaryotic-like serine/threonine-protein kinase